MDGRRAVGLTVGELATERGGEDRRVEGFERVVSVGTSLTKRIQPCHDSVHLRDQLALLPFGRHGNRDTLQ